MGVFVYEATTTDGRKIRGTLRAPDRAQAQNELKKKNLNVVQLKEQKQKKDLFGKPLQARAKTKEVSMMTRQLATMIGAGLTLIESLETLYEQARDPGMKLALDDIIERVRAGSDLSTALSNHPKVFSKIYVNMVKAAEASGQLDAVLVRLSEYLESVEELKREIRGAIMYPAFSLTLIIAITGFLIVFIIPKFKTMFAEMGMEKLPLLTSALLAVGEFARSYILFIIGGFIVLAILFKLYIGTRGGRKQWHWFLFHVPIFGELFRKVSLSRFSKTLATLLESGVNMLGSLEIVAGVAGNRLVEEAVFKARDEVSKGKQLSEPLSTFKVFPPILVRMVAVGEKTGQLETLLKKISEFYDHEVRTTVKALTSILEPILIAAMGAIVGTIVLAIFLPIIELQKKLSGG